MGSINPPITHQFLQCEIEFACPKDWFKLITPETLRDLAIELLMNIEKRKRDHVHLLYQRQVEKKKDAISKIAEKKDKATLRRRKETERLIEMGMDLMSKALQDINRAQKMRELIEALDQKFYAASKEIPGFKKWRSWAMHQVNSLDPLNMSAKRAGRWYRSQSKLVL